MPPPVANGPHWVRAWFLKMAGGGLFKREKQKEVRNVD